MAIYHCSVKVISRSKGRSAVGSSAYRSGEKIENERDGLTHDYSNRKGVVHTEIIAPDHAPGWASDREQLWNEVEKVEKAKNSQLAREVEIALPVEFNQEQQIELVREYVKENFKVKGMVADVAIHDKGDGNPHAHIMLTMRPFEVNGEWGAKAKKEYILDAEGEKIKLKSGQYKSRKIDTVDWNQKETLEQWRAQWAECTNKHLSQHGISQQVDHRSYEVQGVQKAPTIHEGHIVRAMEKRGLETERGGRNKEIEKDNKMIELLNRQLQTYEKQKERENANGRDGVNGTQDRSIGDESRDSRAQEPFEKSINALLYGNRAQYGTDISITNDIQRQSDRQHEEVRRAIQGAQQGLRGIGSEVPRSQRENEQDLQGGVPRNDRYQGAEPREDGKELSGHDGYTGQEREQIYISHNRATEVSQSSSADTKPTLEGSCEAVCPTSTDNNRDRSGDSGSIPSHNPINDILKSLDGAIKKADMVERAEAERLERALTKTQEKQQNRQRQPKRRNNRSWDLER